jgi:hypothetical protein
MERDVFQEGRDDKQQTFCHDAIVAINHYLKSYNMKALIQHEQRLNLEGNRS